MSESKTLTICYTDIKGSSELSTKIGNDRMDALKTEHFRVDKELITRNSGTWIKSLGDGSMSYFNSPAEAVNYLCEFLWIEAKHPGLKFWTFEVKTGFAHGAVKLSNNPIDVSGNTANIAARVVGKSDIGQILLDEEAYKVLVSQWGQEEVDGYCTFKGKEELKGTGKRNLWTFDWGLYVRTKGTITKLIQEKLEEAHLVTFNIVEVPFSTPGLIFWPVVPRTDVNAIHKGQLEIIKLLSFCDWETQLFIADSDRVFDIDATAQTDFEERVCEYAQKIGVSLTKVEYLSKLFDSNSENFRKLMLKFRELTKEFKVRDIFQYEGKSYEDSEAIVNERNILEFLRTIFTLVAFEHFLDNHEQPVMVISGVDERPKWTHYLETRELCNRVNIICNPELKKGSHLLQQNSYQPIWRSKHDFLKATQEMNLTQWAFDLFVCLPQFPKTDFTICTQYCMKDDCDKKPESCENVNEFADAVADSVKDRLGFI